MQVSVVCINTHPTRYYLRSKREKDSVGRMGHVTTSVRLMLALLGLR
jgi:hypothetical protein